MKILVIGSGGREHAIVWKLAQSPRVTQIWCAPGNAGIALERLSANGSPVQCVNIGAEDLPGLLKFALENKVELAVVGPDNSLARGVVDVFQERSLRIFGPNRMAARFESSKIFAQEFMERHGIPTARAGTFSDPRAAKDFAKSLGGACAVKADGLALGKGVILSNTVSEASDAIDKIMLSGNFGKAGNAIVIQELLHGPEISIHAVCDGKMALLFPTSQDHKRLGEKDTGPNTGGMGAYSPAPFVSRSQLGEIESNIISPWLKGCANEGIDFRGILYPGIMLTDQGPKVLEFNARFGDPETQVYLPRLENDLLEVIEASIDGCLHKIQLRWRPEAALCVVMASQGYPGPVNANKIILGLAEASANSDTKIFCAGVSQKDGNLVTSGGRVLAATAWDLDLRRAGEKACEAVAKIQFDGAQFRRDIGAKAFAQE